MGGKLNVYNLGELGINITKSPIHHADGELLSCQNGEFYAEAGLAALRKRAGLQRLNSSVLAGTVMGVLGVPLPAPNSRNIYIALGNALGVTSWERTPTVLTDVPFNDGVQIAGSHTTLDLNAVSTIQPICQFIGRFFYPAATARGRILCYDGVTEFEACRLPISSLDAVTFLFVHRNRIYIGTSVTSPRVYVLNPFTGEVTETGAAFVGETPHCGCSWLGKVWVGTTGAAQGKIYSARAGDAAFVLDRSSGAGLSTYTSVATYKGDLYAATLGLAGTAAVIEKRTPAGVWSTSKTGPHSVQFNYFDGLAVCNGELFAFYRVDGATDICSVYKFDGVSWTLDKDLLAVGGDQVGGRVVVGNTLYVVTVDAADATFRKVFSRSSAGVWAEVLKTGNSIASQQGYVGFI